MTAISDWFKRMFGAVMPSQEGNAWDELKRARSMERNRKVQEMQSSAVRNTPYSSRYKY